MREWILALVPQPWQQTALWGAGAGLILLFNLLAQLYRKSIHPALLRRFEHKEKSLMAVLSANFAKPLTWLCSLLGWQLAVGIAPVSAGTANFMHTLFRLSVIALLGWGLAGSSQLVAYFLRNACRKLDVQTSQSVISFVSSLFKIVVYGLVAVILLSELGYDVNGLVAGLGLGGLTVALAAKESAANFFAGMVLIFEKTFTVGDYITYSELSGTVEKVSFRTTQLRTMADTMVTVPNATLISAPITNWTRMRRRLIRFNIGLRYDTSAEVLQRILDEITAALKANRNLVEETISVSFEKFGSSSLDVLVRYCIDPPDYDGQFAVNQEINFRILEIVRRCGADFAFPSQSIYLEK